ncbi:hypothetical protein BDN67DRAFT_984410 [Paxillus ammoniavirescens]|nr:hypothetical protein BDN67DRAFT_984410 [Paxillus ammoniavirescens]
MLPSWMVVQSPSANLCSLLLQFCLISFSGIADWPGDYHGAGVKVPIEHDMVTGLKLKIKTPPDPICEPYSASKLHANPFPGSEWHASRPLKLMHTDYCLVLPMCAKSDLFVTFKEFKAYALLLSTSGTDAPLMQWTMPLLMGCGMGGHLMSLT